MSHKQMIPQFFFRFPTISPVFLKLDKNTGKIFSISLKKCWENKKNMSLTTYLEMSPAVYSDQRMEPFVSMCPLFWPQLCIMNTSCPNIDTEGVDVCSIHVIPKWQTLSLTCGGSRNTCADQSCSVIWLSWVGCFDVNIPTFICQTTQVELSTNSRILN